MSRIRIGTRGSALALWQAHHVRGRLADLGHEVELRVIVTTGDRVLDRRLENVGGKGAFLKEIEEALLAGEVDLAVHSLKDVPTALPAGLVLCAMLERADPRDALVSGGARLQELPQGALVGTTSLRRRALLRSLRPDLVLEDLRGNVDTRLKRLREGRFDAILLAMAGLTRLGRADEVTEALDPRVFLPAPGQGAIALECRADDAAIRAAVAPLDHTETARAVTAERAFLAALGGGCNVPLGAHAFSAAAEVKLAGFVAAINGSTMLRAECRGTEPVAVGQALARELLELGAGPLLRGLTRVASLSGRRIAVTRRAGQSKTLVRLLQERGASVLEVPAIEVVPPEDEAPLDAALRALGSFQWIAFTSANAVAAVERRTRELGLSRRLTASGARLASVGSATSAALRSAFPDDPLALEPEQSFHAEALAALFAREGVTGARVLLPVSSRAREELPRELRALGAEVVSVVSYRTIEPAELAARVRGCLEEGFDLVAFASPSAVEAFASAAGERGRGLPAVAIGPTTADAARAAGFDVRAVAVPSTAEGLVGAAERALET